MALELLPNIKQRYFDANGAPLAGGKLYSYEAGTSTPLATYVDQAGTTANTNPIILDANGEFDCFVTSGVQYKFVLTDADDVEIWTRDDISGVGFSGITGTGDVAGPAASVNNEIALFSGTTGKVLKRASGSGFVKATSGVIEYSEDIDLESEVTGTLPISVGGTGQTSAQAAIDALLPGQTSANGKFLTSDGSTSSWADPGADYAYSGYSARFSELIDTSDLADTLETILDLQYTAPSVTLTASGSSTVREKGTAVTSSTLTAAITKKSDPIDEVRFYQGASTLLDTQTSGGGIPSGGNSTYAWTGSFSDTTTFKAEVDDSGASGGPTTVTSNTVTFTFVYPYYSGAGSSGLDASGVAALTKSVIVSTATVNKTITATAGQVFYFAYLKSYGALTSILDVNNFETINDWTRTEKTITAADSSSQTYYVYEFNNPVVAGDYYYSFRR